MRTLIHRHSHAFKIVLMAMNPEAPLRVVAGKEESIRDEVTVIRFSDVVIDRRWMRKFFEVLPVVVRDEIAIEIDAGEFVGGRM